VRSFGFLLSRRWILFGLAVVVLVLGTWWLGTWQFGRLEDRKADNAVVRANESREAAPVEQVLAVDREAREDDEWRLVRATGTYAVDETIVVRYRTRDEAAGIDVVVPLVTADGTALLVDRGWLATPNNHADAVDVPAPPAGEVEVTGWVRRDGTGPSTAVSDHSTRAVSSEEIGAATGLTVYDGFVELASESPDPATPLEPVELPELDNGPHFFYGLQWWFFGVLAVSGFLYLVYDEWRTARRGRGEDATEDGTETGEGTGPDPTADPHTQDAPAKAAGASRAARKRAVKEAYRAAYERERSGR
jgi:cytochrome oxidase assembly protein ShyY1